MSFEHPGLVGRLYAFGKYRFAERVAGQHHRIDSGGRPDSERARGAPPWPSDPWALIYIRRE